MIHLPVKGSVTCTVDDVPKVYEVGDRDASYTVRRGEIVVQKALPEFHVSVNIQADWDEVPVAGTHPVTIVVRSGFGPAARLQAFESFVSYVPPAGDVIYVTTVGGVAIDVAVNISSLRGLRVHTTPARRNLPESRPPSPIALFDATRKGEATATNKLCDSFRAINM
tara:strand:+ start:3301 stop:3801 length:501 start_codon:yes stop_codon:yes gene_type:complete